MHFCSVSTLFYTQVKVAMYRPLYMTSKQSSWGRNSKFRHSTEQITVANYIVYKHKNSKTIEFSSILDLCSVERWNFVVVPQRLPF